MVFFKCIYNYNYFDKGVVIKIVAVQVCDRIGYITYFCVGRFVKIINWIWMYNAVLIFLHIKCIAMLFWVDKTYLYPNLLLSELQAIELNYNIFKIY